MADQQPQPAGKSNKQGNAPQGQGQGRKKKQQGRRRRGPKRPADLWRPVPKLPDPEPITPSPDPTVVLQSLGDPPLQANSTAAEHYLAAAVEHAAGMATALAAAGGLLAEPADEDDGADR